MIRDEANGGAAHDAASDGDLRAPDFADDLAHCHPRAATILEQIPRPVAGTTTAVDDLERALAGKGLEVERSEIVEVFRALDRAGVGRFVLGRRGHPSRFEWNPGPDGSEGSGDGGEEVESVGESEVDLIEHTYRLRPGYEVRFSLPVDLTPGEAARLAEFVRTLSFG